MHGPPASAAGDAGATPMMAQYLEIKRRQGDALLFYRMGDFYELFFEDAGIAAKILGIALTHRGRHEGRDIPMCGVPVHAAEHYLQKLIRAGLRVAICEQLEDPAEAKKRGAKSVVRRDMVRLVTPGTLTEDSLLEATARNHLAALAVTGTGDMALAWADISTGAFACMATAKPRLAADLARLSPSELLLADRLLDDQEMASLVSQAGAALSPLPQSRFDSAAGERRLKAHFNLQTLDALGDFTRADHAALGALLDYIALTQVGNHPFLRPPLKERADDGLIIDQATRANLELTRTLQGERKGSLLATINRTVTSAGARLLGDWLARPLAAPEAINARLDAVQFFHGDDLWAEDLRATLKSAPDIERALSRLTGNRGGPRDLAALRDGVKAAQVLEAALRKASFNAMPPRLEQVVAALAAAPQGLAQHLTRALGSDLPLVARDGGFVAPGYRSDLDEHRKLRDETRQVIAALQAHYAAQSGIRSLKVKHNNVLGYFIEVTAQQAELIKGSAAETTFIHRQTIASAVRYTTAELASLESRITEAAARALAVEQEIFQSLLAEVKAEVQNISSAAQALAELDVFLGLAALAHESRYVRPAVDGSLAFSIVNGRHPVVEAALAAEGAQAFQPNSCDLTGDRKRLWLMTGPNMAGKSTFLRQNALILILAQIGSFVPADSARIGVADRIFSRVGAADDLARGRSTFMVEMVETAAILNQATERSLVILDEIGRGTATYDGLSIAWGALEHLHDVNRSRGLFATHYHELTALAQRLEGLACATMKVREWKGDIVFLHAVAEGAADRSYGIQVAKLAGLPASVIARATEVLKRLERDKARERPEGLAEDLPLFAASLARPEPVADPVRQLLAALDADSLSPRAALDLIYQIRELVAQEKSR